MKRGTIVILTAILTALAFFNAGTQPDAPSPQVQLMFAKWVVQNQKSYNPNELLHRLKIFAQNYELIQENMLSNDTHRLVLNKFADLSKDEFKAKYLGYKKSAETREIVRLPTINQAASIDWRTKGIVNPIKNQGQCGSCWAFSAIAALEGAYAQKTGHLESFSEQQLVDCSGSFGNMGCGGGLMTSAFKYLQQKPAELESVYPYTARDQTCKFKEKSGVVKIITFKELEHSENSLVAGLNSHVISVSVDAEQWQLYAGGVFSNCGTNLDHGVAAVGYGTENGASYWIVRNSWGSTWGEKGYIKILKGVSGDKGTCGILMDMSFPVV